MLRQIYQTVGSLLPSLPLPLCPSPASTARPCSRSPFGRPPPAPGACSLRFAQVDPLPGPAAVQVAVGSGAARGVASGGAGPGGAESEGAKTGGAEPGGVEPGGAELGATEREGVEPGGAASEGVASEGAASEGAETGGAEPPASGVGSAGAAGAGGAGVAARAGVTGGTATTDPMESRASGAGGARAGVGGPGVGGAGAVDLGGTSQLASPLPAPSPYTEQFGGLTERRVPAPRPISPIHATCRVPRSRPPPVPGTHTMALRPSSVPLRVPLPPPPAFSLPEVPDPVSDRAHAASPTVARLLATAVATPRCCRSTSSYLGLQITRDRAQRTITLTQSHMVHQVLQRFGFQLSSPQPTPLSTSHSLSAPPTDESVEPSGPYPELVGCLMHRKVHWDAAKRVLRYLCITSGMGLVVGGRSRVVFTGHADASWVDDSATQRSSQGYTFSLGSGSMSWRSTRSSSVLSSSCEADIYAGAMAQELCWLTYFLTDLGEQPRSPPVLYVDNKAMIALCQDHRLEHRTKHIALRYFLACELQQRGQLHLAYVATWANTADIFTKALLPSDHQRFTTVLGLVPTLPHLLTA
ncbi:unnamed protein product [Closterium sp. NIES-54]